MSREKLIKMVPEPAWVHQLNGYMKLMNPTGGIQPFSYHYRCLACGREITEENQPADLEAGLFGCKGCRGDLLTP